LVGSKIHQIHRYSRKMAGLKSTIASRCTFLTNFIDVKDGISQHESPGNLSVTHLGTGPDIQPFGR
jgi:hypothetical protein